MTAERFAFSRLGVRWGQGVLLCLLFVSPVWAAESPQLKKCLQRADDLPDIAATEATVWLKKDGGNDAHLCHAFAQSNRGMHQDAAREFWYLASFYESKDSARAVALHNIAGQEFLRAKDAPNAKTQYAAALKLSPENAASLTGYGQAQSALERYWDALETLNHALKRDPDFIDALRARGRVWIQLGNKGNAQEDFAHAEELEATPK